MSVATPLAPPPNLACQRLFSFPPPPALLCHVWRAWPRTLATGLFPACGQVPSSCVHCAAPLCGRTAD
eukprot:11106716-Alexandrium_andersonii.AAC.1